MSRIGQIWEYKCESRTRTYLIVRQCEHTCWELFHLEEGKLILIGESAFHWIPMRDNLPVLTWERIA